MTVVFVMYIMNIVSKKQIRARMFGRGKSHKNGCCMLFWHQIIVSMAIEAYRIYQFLLHCNP